MKRNQTYGLDQVNVSFLDIERSTSLPLVISPRWNDSLDFLTAWLESNRAWVDEKLLQYGAVLIRGFQVHTPTDFEKATLALQPDLCDSYRGTSPRTLVKGTKYAFSAADVPVNYPIAQHLEMSFLKAPPRHLYFGCMKASKKPGGETALCDFRKVYQDIPSELRGRFEAKKIKYTRTHFKVGEKYTYDVGAMLGWPSLFGTSDKTRVQEICKEEGAPQVSWIGPNGDTFTQEWYDEPFQRHPITNEPVWFNHSQVFHWTTFPSELFFAFRRVYDLNLFIHFLLVSLFAVIKYGILGCKMALDTTFGDGTPITFREMVQIRAAIHKNMVFSRWKRGDILAIDNFSVSHGRQPTYDKGRKVIVSWSQPHDKTKPIPDASMVSFETSCSSDKNTSTHDSPPKLVAASPECSFESTLTKAEAQELKESLLAKHFEKQMADAFSRLECRKRRRNKRLASCPDLLHSSSDFWKLATDE